MAKPVVLEEKISVGRQSVTWQQTCIFEKFKVQFTIVSDAFRSQCSAIARVWNPDQLKWNVVHALFPTEMCTPDRLAYYSGDTAKSPHWFKEDHDTLANMVWSILL